MAEGGAAVVDSAKAGLNQKIGGVPFYVYGAVAVAGFYFWKRHKASTTAATTAADVTTAPNGTPDSVAYQSPDPSLGGPTPFYTQNNDNSNADSGDTTLADQAKWVSNGVSYLVAAGYDGASASSALSMFASGANLTGSQLRLVNLWISAPQGGPAPGVKAPATPEGAGISFDVPSTISIVPISGWSVKYSGPLVYQVIWKDGYGQPITGSLIRYGNAGVAGKTFLARETLAIKNGVGQVSLPVITSGQFKYSTMPTDTTHTAQSSPVVSYTVGAPPKK